jgi:hypothetical protein
MAFVSLLTFSISLASFSALGTLFSLADLGKNCGCSPYQMENGDWLVVDETWLLYENSACGSSSTQLSYL